MFVDRVCRGLTAAILVFVYGVIALSAVTIVATAAGATNGKQKVTICHATSSEKNPYVQITVSVSAVDGEGKNDHSHHVNDIIPPPYALNWTAEGQATYNNGCKVPTPTPPPTTTTPPPPTTVPEPPSTTTPPPVVTVPNIPGTPSHPVCSIPGKGLYNWGDPECVEDPTPAPAVPTPVVVNVPEAPTELAFTGANSIVLALSGISAAGAGTLLTRKGRK